MKSGLIGATILTALLTGACDNSHPITAQAAPAAQVDPVTDTTFLHLSATVCFDLAAQIFPWVITQSREGWVDLIAPPAGLGLSTVDPDGWQEPGIKAWLVIQTPPEGLLYPVTSFERHEYNIRSGLSLVTGPDVEGDGWHLETRSAMKFLLDRTNRVQCALSDDVLAQPHAFVRCLSVDAQRSRAFGFTMNRAHVVELPAILNSLRDLADKMVKPC